MFFQHLNITAHLKWQMKHSQVEIVPWFLGYHNLNTLQKNGNETVL